MMQNFKLKIEKKASTLTLCTVHYHAREWNNIIKSNQIKSIQIKSNLFIYYHVELLVCITMTIKCHLCPVQCGDMSPNWNTNRTAYLSVNISTERHMHLVPCETTQVSLTWQTKVQYKKVYQNRSTKIKRQYQKQMHKQILHAINYANVNNSCMEWIIQECIVYTQVQIFIKDVSTNSITRLLFACIFN